MIQFEKLGIFLSKPIAFLIVLIYLLQSGLLVYLIRDKINLEKQIEYQQVRINELEERLQIFKAIDDFQIGFNEDEVHRLTDVIYRESKKYHYDPMFTLAIILTESSFKRGQKSHVGARVDWEGSHTLFEPEANIKLGTLHLFEQVLKFGDIKKALLSYNIGEARLRGLIRGNKPLPKAYLNRVLQKYQMLKETYQV